MRWLARHCNLAYDTNEPIPVTEPTHLRKSITIDGKPVAIRVRPAYTADRGRRAGSRRRSSHSEQCPGYAEGAGNVVANGMFTLVRGPLPAPTRGVFAIVAKRYTYKGHTSLDLTAEWQLPGITGISQNFTVEEPLSVSSKRKAGPPVDEQQSPFSFSEKPVGCDPALTLVWGLLRVPLQPVLIRSGTTSKPLTRVEIPASLHTGGGELAYGMASTASTLMIEHGGTNEERTLETPPSKSPC